MEASEVTSWGAVAMGILRGKILILRRMTDALMCRQVLENPDAAATALSPRAAAIGCNRHPI
jgi:hypothetical protein